MRVAVIIPALNEEESVAHVIADVPPDLIYEIIVVDNGSTDRTAEVARAAGARVVREERRGYGYACLAGAEAAESEVLVFLDADGSFAPREISALVKPILEGRADLVLGSRELGEMEKGAIFPHQRFGNWLAVRLLRHLYGLEVTDLGPFRAIRRAAFEGLGMSEMTYGWPTEMMVKSARLGYRTVEVPVSYRPRLGGRSKVAGTVKGTVLAGYCIISTTLKHAWPHHTSSRKGDQPLGGTGEGTSRVR